MDDFTIENICKYCSQKLEICFDEGLQCIKCKMFVHVRCLLRGSVPGGINGDVFYTYTCQVCSTTESEEFTRNKLSWMQIIVLVLYHLQTKSPGLARKGFFHWRNHVASFVDRNWDVLFEQDVKKKKKWHGTIAGTLSHFNSYIFLSGTSTFGEQAWWTLLYPKLSPWTTTRLYALMNMEKQKLKLKNEKKLISDAEYFENVLSTYIKNKELLQPFNISTIANLPDVKDQSLVAPIEPVKQKNNTKRKINLPSIENPSKKMMKLANSASFLSDDLSLNLGFESPQEMPVNVPTVSKTELSKPVKLLDPFLHYNTSLNNISRIKSQLLQNKLTGGIRKEQILSPYSAIYLKPYIRRDVETCPVWLKLMAEVQIKANKNNFNFVLPPRSPIDYTYVQPEHIPAINSLCNQFFWPGIDLTESLQFPDFSCVVLYKKLIIGFAFLVPDVKHTENYISFIFTRPSWRNCGIGKFMLYHLIQTSLGKDVTLHVSINSPALLLYQKFGFKVEHVVLDFYDKYYRSDVKESKHAFFCRLER